MNALDPSLLFFPLSSRNLQASSGHFPSHHLTSRPPDPQPRLVTTVTSGSPLIHLVCALELLSYPEFSSGTFPDAVPTSMTLYQAAPGPPAEKQCCR